MDKSFLVEQLNGKLRTVFEHARKFDDEARTEAKTGANRAVNLAKATGQRFDAARAAIEALEGFKPPPFNEHQPLGLGAMVEIEDGNTGKSLFVAPAGAGEELTGPGGDGFFQVVTPASPLGKALLGRRVGDVIETMIKGELTEWTIVFAE